MILSDILTWIWELIHAWILSQISDGWCLGANAAARYWSVPAVSSLNLDGFIRVHLESRVDNPYNYSSHNNLNFDGGVGDVIGRRCKVRREIKKEKVVHFLHWASPWSQSVCNQNVSGPLIKSWRWTQCSGLARKKKMQVCDCVLKEVFYFK